MNFKPDHALLSHPLMNALASGNAETLRERALSFAGEMINWTGAGEETVRSSGSYFTSIAESHGARARNAATALTELAGQIAKPESPEGLLDALKEYLVDRAQRMVLTLDTLRERGDIFFAHEEAGCPPVLAYEYDVEIDGRDLPHPVNYMLLKIRPPEGVTVIDQKRPYVIIDPRAGHGAGIGGFKFDSQVGVALKRGHPVYFVSFRRDPMPGQTLADVTRAEATFVRHVQALHPQSAKPVVIGNCQGGWATLVLGATAPDLTGPLILNGAPVETWSGHKGQNTIRYNAGIQGGEIGAMLMADLGNGVFDGAWLVRNFEQMNPSRNYFRKYYDLFVKVDSERQRFLDFERWWGGFFLLNEAEIVWIVRQLFVGNRLARNEARLEHGRALDIKQVRSPIIVFASYGDNITPPSQALNWILDTYTDETEIQIRGQRIVYMVHESVGHLGIFVSASIARREHAQVASILKTIEALAPGLYEMVIEDTVGEGTDKHFVVSFAERKTSDLPTLNDREDTRPFAAVARLSEMQGQAYDVFLRPFVKATTNPALANLRRATHPLRVQRAMFASRFPYMMPIKAAAETARKDRKPASATNPFIKAETLWADLLEQSMDLTRDLRDVWTETMFYSIYSSPVARWFGAPFDYDRAHKSKDELFALPEVQVALSSMKAGGFVEAVIRMLILLANARGTVRRDRLERSAQVLTQDEPFRSLDAATRARIIHQQGLIVEFGGDAAINTLADLQLTHEEKVKAAAVVQYVPGAMAEMEPKTLATLQKMRAVLGLSPATEEVTLDPLTLPQG
ncbi:DUF3141 domain-containing protein [Segnochrobactraceae bacterium EtOH-i3]